MKGMTRFLLFGLLAIALIGIIGRRARGWENQDLQATISAAQSKPILAVFGTSWCHYCKQLERETLSDSEVSKALEAWEVVKVDAESPKGRTMAQKYGVRGYPTMVFLRPNGEVIQSESGFVAKEVFLPVLAKIYAKSN